MKNKKIQAIVNSVDIFSDEMNSLIHAFHMKAIKENNDKYGNDCNLFHVPKVGEMGFAGMFGILEIPPENQEKFYEEYSELQRKYKVQDDEPCLSIVAT